MICNIINTLLISIFFLSAPVTCMELQCKQLEQETVQGGNFIAKVLKKESQQEVEGELNTLATGTLNNKYNFFRDCIHRAIDINNTDPYLLLPIFDRIFTESDLQPASKRYKPSHTGLLHLFARDAELFNYILFKYNPPLKDPYSLRDALCKIISMLTQSRVCLGEKQNENTITYYENNAFRLNGKIFIDLIAAKEEDYTQEARTEYFKTAFRPTIVPSQFQSCFGTNRTIQSIKKSIEAFLLCAKRMHTLNGPKIPKVVVDNLIIVDIFSQTLNTQLIMVKNNIQEAIKDYNAIMPNIDFIRDPVQQKFFDKFSQWYDEKCNEITRNKFEVVKLLLSYKK